MAGHEPKTRARTASVPEFLARLPGPRRADAEAVAGLLTRATGARPKLWGASIIGFGEQVITYADGKTLPWPLVAMSPRKSERVLSPAPRVLEDAPLLRRLGKHGTGKGCLYVRMLAGVDLAVLQEIVARSVAAKQVRKPREPAAAGKASRQTRSRRKVPR